jgi:hypothetical protein
MRMIARSKPKRMADPLREACDKASAALGGNPKGTMKMAPIAALLAPYWEQSNRVARALHWKPFSSFAHVA